MYQVSIFYLQSVWFFGFYSCWVHQLVSLGWLLLRLASSNSGSVTRTGLLVHGLELITEFAGAPALLSSAGQQQARRSSIYSVVVVACTLWWRRGMCFLVVSKHPPPQTEYYNAPWWTWRAPDCCRTPAEAHLRLQAFAKEAVEAAALLAACRHAMERKQLGLWRR